MSVSKAKAAETKRSISTVKFGKAPAKRDARNLKLGDVLRKADRLPAEYDFDVKHKAIPTPMFGNNKINDCVIAGRAHQTLRFEMAEKKILIRITDKDVMREYLKETGGGDGGLAVLDSLKLWRTRGWKAAGKNYKIKAFAEIDPTNRAEIKRSIFINIGVGLGFFLPDSAKTQFKAGQPWKATRLKPHKGHYVYASGYTARGPVCITWGRKQQMTWEFLDKYCDEAYAIIDAIDTPTKKRNLDEKKINKFLEKCTRC